MKKVRKRITFWVLLALLISLFTPALPAIETLFTDIAAAAEYPAWSSSKVYVGGDMVSYNGKDYRAQWWTQGETPGVAQVWVIVSSDSTVPEEWSSTMVYVGGNIVTYNGQQYRAQWWTLGERPGTADVWVPIGTVTVTPTPTITITPTPTITPVPEGTFKAVGYYPSWEPDKTNRIQYNNLTHINYAFAIPKSDGTLMPLENASLAQQIIQNAHANGVKVLLSVGGWSYNDVPLESTFMSATSTQAKTEQFGNAMIAMANQYGFDGVDVDWEHPRNDGTSKQQYENLMVYLSGRLHSSGKLLTAAVLSGVTPDGVVYWDAAAHTDTVLNCLDWINVMAYDGGDGERHSSYNFAVACGNYWHITRNMPAEKVVLGVPFYGRPSWASYDEILQANPNAYNTDTSTIYGMLAYYNGIPTIQRKTQWACENIGGMMMWELSQDTTDSSKSLLSAMARTIRSNFSDWK